MPPQLLCFCFMTLFSVAVLEQLDPLCGDWKPYKKEQCVIFSERSGLLSRKDAEDACHSLSHGNEEVSRLVTIKTKEKQDFIQKLIFDNDDIVENLWLGINLDKDGTLTWNDGTELKYTNWKNQKESNDEGNSVAKKKQKHVNLWHVQDRAGKGSDCIEMQSGENGHPIGIWNKANCKVRKLVVCEKSPSVPMDTMQNDFSELKKELDKHQKDLEEHAAQLKKDTDQKLSAANQLIDNIKKNADDEMDAAKRETDLNIDATNKELEAIKQSAKEKLAALKEEVNRLKSSAVPEGFVYVQLPSHEPPAAIWPHVTWKEISDLFPGQFFRVLEKKSSSFEHKQDDNTRYINWSKSLYRTEFWKLKWGMFKVEAGSEVTIPTDGSECTPIWTGSTARNSPDIGIRFKITAGEVRPRNKAVKIWQRVK